MSRLNLKDGLVSKVTRGVKDTDKINIFGLFKMEHYRDGIKIYSEEAKNVIMTAAKDSIFNTFFNAATQVAAVNFVLSLIDNSGFSAISAADLMTSHAGWNEYTGYTQSVRPPWGQGTAASGSITNATGVTFTFASSQTMKGAFVTTNNTKGGTTGLLISAAAFTSDRSVVNGDEIKLNWTYTA